MRRIITAVVEGKSVFLADGEPANSHAYEGWPGHETAVIWATARSEERRVGKECRL